MHIQELALDTRQLAPQKAFYSATLGLPLVEQTADSFAVQAGATRLRFRKRSKMSSIISPLQFHTIGFTKRNAGYRTAYLCSLKMVRMSSSLPVSMPAHSTFVTPPATFWNISCIMVWIRRRKELHLSCM